MDNITKEKPKLSLMKPYIQIAKLAEERKAEIEANRNIPSDIMEQVKDAGLVKRWATKAVGGEEAAVSEVTQMLREMAYYNGSLAWVIGVTGCSALFSGFIGKESAQAFFSDPHCMVGGFAGPAGVGMLTEGGLKVSGHWRWGSGITHCSHIVGGVKIMDGTTFKGTGIILFKPEELNKIDNWHVLGLKGTHSIDYSTKDTFIPNGRWFPFPVTKATVDAPLYRFSFLGALSLAVASTGLGLAKRAIDELKTLATTKRPFGQGKPLAKRADMQVQIGKLEGQYQAAIALFNQTIAKAEKEVEKGSCSTATKAQIRLASAHSTTMAHTVVQGAFNMAAGSAIWQSQKLEELIRDMNVAKQHGMVNVTNYRTVGAVLVGEDVPSVLL